MDEKLMSDMPEPDLPPLPPTDNPAPEPGPDIPPLDPLDLPEGEPPAIPTDVPFIQPPGTQ
jgi:hypothetical protein